MAKTTYFVRRFLKSSPTMPRAHWYDTACYNDLAAARAHVARLNEDPSCVRGGVFLTSGAEI
jgi:hypothetical protein